LAHDQLHMWIPRQVEPRPRRSAKTRPVLMLNWRPATPARLPPFGEYFRTTSSYLSTFRRKPDRLKKSPTAFFIAPAPVINEMQNAPALFRHLKSAVHAQATSHGQFLA